MLPVANESADAHVAFDALFREVEPKLRRAFVALYGPDRGRDATAEALAYAWEHRERVSAMDNPAGYLFRVGQSRSRRRRSGYMVAAGPLVSPASEPRLGHALERLSDRQRLAVVLCFAYQWTSAEAAELMGVSRGSVQRHLSRALAKLRRELGVVDET
jgi:DNA-directed RNA polymerase specialized sigma24 family protein